MSEASDRLFKAVVSGDADTSLALLEAAGGACQARDLVKQAASHEDRPWAMRYSILVEGDKETIMLSREFLNSYMPQSQVAGLKQDKCKR
ncbi:MAG: hypothetical protein K2X81_03530 [Candidatus Obscuribacterales bacterium]|nr:hypothetical protein [Candidatus Obscuribacterales bacterium]